MLKIIHEGEGDVFVYDGLSCSHKKDEQKNIAVDKQQAKLQGAYISPQERKKKYVLGEIIDKMRKEQDEIMRAPVDGVTLIRGAAGSGKTDIAFHRIVYLVREFPNEENPNRVFKEENIAVFCFNVSLKKYLENLIKELNIERVKIFSIDEWLRNLLITFSDIVKINYIEDDQKSFNLTRKETLNQIQEFLKQKMDKISSAIQDNENLSGLVQLKNEVKDLNDINVLRDNAYEKLKHYEIDRDGKERQVPDTDGVKEQKKTINKELESIIKKHLCKQWAWGTGDKDNKIIFNGINLLSEFYGYINDEKLTQRFETTINSSDAIILAHIINLLSGRLKIFPYFDHIVIDEVQDFTPLQMLLLRELHKNSMTIVGDITQGIFSQGVKKWEDFGFLPDNIYELKLSHRSTLENILFANEVLLSNDQNILTSEVAKRGEKPYLLRCSNFDETLKFLVENIKEIKSKEPNSSIVVTFPLKDSLENICENLRKNTIDAYVARKDNWTFCNKIHVTTYHQIKGLEFDYVFILGLNIFEKGRWSNKENVLYTVITRARNKCLIFYLNDFPKMLKNVDSDLYDHYEIK